MQVSIIIPTIERTCLEECLDSVNKQTYRDFETILVKEEGPLARLRNEGAKRAKGEILVFIDDDVICERTWLEEIVKTLASQPNIGGVSGPAIITSHYRRNRDIFKFKLIKEIYDWFFLEGMENLPGHIAKSGAWTTGACNEDCMYEGYVEFLEACNMSFRRNVFEQVGGFDESYQGIGDWSEPDLAFRIRELGYELFFNRNARLYHCPSKTGVFLKRDKDAPNRLKNYLLFSSRWVDPCFQHTLYKAFLRLFYGLKSIKR